VASDKLPYILIGIYQSLYEDKYRKKPKINKYREKWAMQDVIDSVGYDRAKELLEYYFRTNKSGHPLSFFYYNFDKIDQLKTEIDRDKINRERLRAETKKMVESEE
jgi:hypothetical protein